MLGSALTYARLDRKEIREIALPDYLVTNPRGERFLIGCDTIERARQAVSALYPDEHGRTTEAIEWMDWPKHLWDYDEKISSHQRMR